jgi:glycosyltransferase involved in cell wall biosynthesis
MSSANFNIIGFFLSEIGLGNTARYIAHSMLSENFLANYINIHLDGRSNDLEFVSQCSPYEPNKVNFVVSSLKDSDWIYSRIQQSGSYLRNYLYPFWELDRIPHEKLKVLSAYDEIIAPSTFIANTFSNFLGKEIKKILHPVRIPANISPNLIRGGTLKIFSFMDFDSHVARKNPQGILDAFKHAFPNHYDDVELIIKVRGLNDFGMRKILQGSCAKDSRIKIIDKTLPRDAMDVLLEECNVYISMHRSEGFGLGPAEALAHEKIVISTDYGGTTDFITKKTGYPLEYKLIPVESNAYPFGQNQMWADPSVDSAVESLRDIYHNYDNALLRGISGRQLMIDQHSFHNAGKALKLLV